MIDNKPKIKYDKVIYLVIIIFVGSIAAMSYVWIQLWDLSDNKYCNEGRFFTMCENNNSSVRIVLTGFPIGCFVLFLYQIGLFDRKEKK